ncbi:hypothetical protein CSB09_01070 [Candidatus Gracilibacteria bacterium]|nr:MAG: hypothetical protein CSB09_01070 [Candidatus Gracilibacteria bacterium]
MQRFFTKDTLDDIYTITDNAWIHQLSRVLRGKVGDEIILFQEDGTQRVYTLSEIRKKQIILQAQGEKTQVHREQKQNIILYQALPNKWEKIEYIIQKSVEVGIEKIVFFRSQRSQKLVISQKKRERWENIATEALEQCGGYRPTVLEYVDSLSQVQIPASYKHIVLHTQGKSQSVQDIYDKKQKKYALWVGPEGGWSDEEISFLSNNNSIIAHFGERILRTETMGAVIGFAILHGYR